MYKENVIKSLAKYLKRNNRTERILMSRNHDRIEFTDYSGRGDYERTQTLLVGGSRIEIHTEHELTIRDNERKKALAEKLNCSYDPDWGEKGLARVTCVKESKDVLKIPRPDEVSMYGFNSELLEISNRLFREKTGKFIDRLTDQLF